jgi:hypothetical protein
VQLPGHVKRLGHPGEATLEPRELKILGQLGILCRTEKCTRMNIRPSGLSPYCWLATMFGECWRGKR